MAEAVEKKEQHDVEYQDDETKAKVSFSFK